MLHRLRDPQRFLPLLRRLLESLPHFGKPSQYAEAAWAVARLGHDPGPMWIAELLDASRWGLHGATLQHHAQLDSKGAGA